MNLKPVTRTILQIFRFILLTSILLSNSTFNGVTSVNAQNAFGGIKAQNETDGLSEAIDLAIANHNVDPSYDYLYSRVDLVVDADWGYADVVRLYKDSGEIIPTHGYIILAHLNQNGNWNTRLPEQGSSYNDWLEKIPSSLIDDLVKNILFSQTANEATALAAVSGHYLPWPAQIGARVTQNYNTHGLGQIDFVPDNNDVLATKDGTIVYVNDTHWKNGSSNSYATYNNVVVVRHTSSEYTIYLHLKQNSVPAWIKAGCPNGSSGQTCSLTIQRGSKIGEVGTVGYSTGNHLHLSTGSSFYVDTNNADWADEDGDGNTTELTYTAFTTSHITADFVEYSYDSLKFWPNSVNNKVYSQNSGGSQCPPPSLSSPGDNHVSTSQNISFSWSPVSGCTFNGYTFRIKDTPNMDSGGTVVDGIDEGVGGTSVSKTISSQWKNRDLWWGVRAANAPNGANWSTRKFRIEDPPNDPVTLFTSTSYTGSPRYGWHDPGSFNLPDYMSDKSWSIQIAGGWSARLFEHSSEGGGEKCYNSSDPDFHGDTYDTGNEVNNSASSIIIYNQENCPPLDPIILYERNNLEGQKQTWTSSGSYNLNGTLDNVSSSIRIQQGWSARVFQDPNKGGGQSCFDSTDTDFGGNTFNNGASVNEAVSSIEVYQQENCPAIVPGAFNKTAPSNNSTNQSTSPSLAWESSSNATSYEYCIDTSNDNACSSWISNSLNTSLTLSNLAGSTTYYWHVRSKNSSDTTYSNGSPTAFWSFTTQSTLPGDFGKTAPSNNATNQSTSPSLAWGTSSGADRYEYCFDTTNDYDCSPWIPNGSNTSITLSNLAGNTTYYWQVRAVNSSGFRYANGGSIIHWSFTTLLPGTGVSCGQVNFNGVILYENKLCNSEVGGMSKSFTAPTAWIDIVSDPIHDKTSSIYVKPGWSVKVFEAATFDNNGMAWRCISSSMWDLSLDFYTHVNTSHVIDDTISSLQVYNNENCADLYTLTVSKQGTGSGTITSNPAGISCGVDCSEVYPANTQVSLNATPATDSTFVSWGGDQDCLDGQVSMNSSVACTATFQIKTYTLSIIRSGTGTGTVTSSPAGINCGADCSEVYTYNTQVTLTASPTSPATFGGWSGGGCSGTGTCTVTMSAARTVTATFNTPTNQTLTTSVTGTGSGTISSTPLGIDCGSDCSESYTYNTSVTLTALPAADSLFSGWSGACTGTGTCVVSMNTARSVTANFMLKTFSLTVSKSGTGSGTVTSSPGGINCGPDCSETYTYNTVVTLTAVPVAPATFGGWTGGGCSGTGICTVTMTAARSVTAIFNPPDSQTLTVFKAGTGNGTIASNPAGISCGNDCTESFAYNTSVTLTATPASGSSFAGWSGACTGLSTCVLSMTANRSVTATFTSTVASIPEIPSNFNVVSSTLHSVTLEWQDNSTNEEGFKIYRWRYGEAGWNFYYLDTVDANVTEYTQYDLTCGSDFNYYEVSAYNAAGESGHVGWVQGTTSPCPDLAPNPRPGRADPIVVSSVPGTSTEDVLFTGQDSYFDWGFINLGNGDVNSDYHVDLYIDDQRFIHYPFSSLGVGADSGFDDWAMPWNESGWHTVKLVVDPDNTVDESNEDNNVWQKDFYWEIRTFNLTITKAGSGSGLVTSQPTGINCGSDCSELYEDATTVTLTAASAIDSTFTGWSGACSGNGTCVVSMTADTSVTANFVLKTYTLTVNKSGTGTGTVISNPAGINCGSDCSEAYTHNTAVTLTASAVSPFTFGGWNGGGCSGTGTCTVTMSAAKTVIATFNPPVSLHLAVAKTGTGNGLVSSNPIGISCGSDCSQSYSYNMVVTLTASASPTSIFAGWSGDCSGMTPTCAVTMDAAKSVVASFVLLPTYPNLLLNGGFEEGSSTPTWWEKNAWTLPKSTFTWDTTQKHSGNRSIKIVNTAANDARWIQTVQVQPNSNYRLSGWIKTQNVGYTQEFNDFGANLSTLSPFSTSSSGLFGTNDWTHVSYEFNTGEQTEVAIAARVGTYSGTITGTAWFDDLKLELLSTPECYTLTTGVTGAGSIINNSVANCNGGTQYIHGTVVKLTGIPSPGFVFGGWSGDVSGSDNPVYVTMMANQSVTANFATIPAKPRLLAPANRSRTPEEEILFQWDGQSPAPHHHEIQVAVTYNFDPSKQLVTSTTTGTSYQFDLNPGTDYFWRVRAFNEFDQPGTWSETWMVETGWKPPTLSSPCNNENTRNVRPTFQWSNLYGGNLLTLQVSQKSNFTDLVLNATVTGLSYTSTKDLRPNTHYYWRMRTNGNNGPSVWSPYCEFTTGNPPTVPVLAAPVNNALVKDYTPLLNWNNSKVPTGTTIKHYELQLDEDKAFSSPETYTTTPGDLTDSDYTMLTDLASNTKYYWRVRAINEVNGVDHTSGWSAVRWFRTVIASPTGLTVIPDGLQPTFAWDAATGPGLINSYTIQISTNAKFTSFVLNSTTQNAFYEMTKNLPSGKLLYWRVRVNGSNGPSDWTTVPYTTP